MNQTVGNTDNNSRSLKEKWNKFSFIVKIIYQPNQLIENNNGYCIHIRNKFIEESFDEAFDNA